MTRAISVLLGLGLLAATGVAAAFPRGFQEHAAVQESLSRVHPRMRARWLKERGLEDAYYTSVRTDSGSGLECIGRWSYGPSYDVDGRTTASETLVALARGSGVSLLRFSRQDSLTIELLSDINAEGLMCRVKVANTLLYVGSRRGLEVYNIADEQNPIRLSWTPIPLNDFALQDSLAYTISGDDSFRIYNVSNPASPVFRGACRDSGDLVSVAGNAAFLGDRWGLYVIDVTNPASPHRIGSWGSAVEQVQARGHLCYVTTFNPNEPGDITFHILDVTVPSVPYQIGSLDSVGGNDVCLIDTLAFGAGETDFNELTVISVADSTRPRLIGSAATPGWSFGIWASALAQEAFVGCHWEGLQLYDTRNASLPVRDTFLLGCDHSVDIYIDNDRAYVANEKAGLKILDISDPGRPATLGSYDTTWQRPFMSSVVARDSFAYVEWSRPKFRTLTVVDPAHPAYAGTCELFAYPEDMVLRDSFVYCAEMNRFQIVNVARPREPVLVGSCNLPGNSGKMDMQDSIAYVTNTLFSIVNVAKPSGPTVVGNYGARMHGVDVVDTVLFGAAPYTGLLALSVADPTHPYALDSLPLTDTIWWNDVAVVGSRAYVGGERVWVVDVSDPRDLRLVSGASWTPPYLVERLEYVSPYLYATCLDGGVCVLESTAVAISDQEPQRSSPTRSLRVEPNPADGCVRVFGIDSVVAVRVFDATGRDVTWRVRADSRASGLSLDVRELQTGLYFVEGRTAKSRSVVKVVKQ